MHAREFLPRLVLAAAIAGGVGYIFTWDLELPKALHVAAKGSGVGLLALYAALLAKDADGIRIAAVMAFGALGDVLLDAVGLQVGAVAFLVGHVIAITLYAQNLRSPLSPARIAGAAAFVLLVCAAAYSLPADRAGAPAVALYTAGLAAMAAMAWMSRFPRTSTGVGALMFVASDLLIFGQLGPWDGAPGIGLGIWGLYFGGQLLICLGVTRTLAAAPRTFRPVTA